MNSNIQTAVIPDSEYEQVIAQRYLFASYVNESTAWPVLNNIKHVWQVISLPQYHSQATEGVWLLSEVMNENDKLNSSSDQYQMSWMSLSANGSLVVLSRKLV
ncbi:unnamed protein product [Rotaria sp. Silwood2]|nr:unnamed protein product [Rotaria sp. Silwood2]CAF2639424.1 unnamed protein product [Rotaria sp. Silwood2]CAF3190566.1 unnamed protein product [Rotaria sp. Silwood2]CAF4363289.1 unnamed protein product [Rotaria sp. Silwood2]